MSFFKKGVLPDKDVIDTRLLIEPAQTKIINPQDIHFDYKSIDYVAQPLYEYSISGLVVSHNNPTGFGDIYHDDTSVDTKDLCITWGENLLTNDYKKINFYNGSTWCYSKYSEQVRFDFSKLSNNHLVTNNQKIRDIIEKVRVGDQVSMKGKLVNYYYKSTPSSIRKTSITRNDNGAGACEVVFVEEFNVISKGKRYWFLIFSLAIKVILVLLILLLALFFIENKLKHSRSNH